MGVYEDFFGEQAETVHKEVPEPPTVEFVREFYHLRDDELNLVCNVTGVPRPKVTWTLNNYELKQNKTVMPVEEGHGVCCLKIFMPTSKDNGIYVCKAENASGTAQIRHRVEVGRNLNFRMDEKEKLRLKRIEETQAEMEAYYKAQAQKGSPEPEAQPNTTLRFVTHLIDRIALIGTTVRLACMVSGPDPICIWTKDEKRIPYTGNVCNLSEGNKAILEIAKVSTESSGLYKCIAKNEFSEAETSCYFRVCPAQFDGPELEPIFGLPITEFYHAIRNEFTITTRVRGNPRPKITWLKDDKPIVVDGRIVTIEDLDGLCEVIIHEPTHEDAGVYTCVAENKLGSVSVAHDLVFEDYPELMYRLGGPPPTAAAAPAEAASENPEEPAPTEEAK